MGMNPHNPLHHCHNKESLGLELEMKSLVELGNGEKHERQIQGGKSYLYQALTVEAPRVHCGQDNPESAVQLACSWKHATWHDTRGPWDSIAEGQWVAASRVKILCW